MKSPIRLLKNYVQKRFLDWVDPTYGTFRYTTPGSYTSSKATKLSTVYRCVNLLSDSVASLTLMPYIYRDNWKYQDYESGLYNLLNVQPNDFVGAYMFKKMIIVHMLLRGNAYVFIERTNSGKVTAMHLLHPDFMYIEVAKGEIRYVYTIAGGGQKIYDKSQIIHFVNYTDDGINGISTLQYAANSLGIAYSSEEHAGNFWQSGANMSGILRPLPGATMSKTQQTNAKAAMKEQLASDSGGTSGSIIVLGDGLEYQSISVNPKDSQLLESRQFNVIEICRFFGVPPSLAFSETAKYATAEQQSIDYLNNGLGPVLEKVENESFRKIYLPSEWNTRELRFDTENLLRMDAATRADYYSKLHGVAGYTSNEVREKLNAPFPLKGGNRGFVPVNLQPIDALISEQVVKNPDAPVDNQVK